MKKYIPKAFVAVLVLLLPVLLTIFGHHDPVKSISSIKDQLSNAQLSYFGRISSANNSVIVINSTTGPTGSPSNSTTNLSTGDSVAVADVGASTSTVYIVKDLNSSINIELTANLGSGNTTAGAYVIATRSAIHAISFTPQASAVGESWQFFIKATNRSGEIYNDGIPDQSGFDLGATTPTSGANGIGTRLKNADVTCPYGGTASVGSTTVITSVSTGYTGAYHIIQCPGNGSIGVSATVTIGQALASGSQLINPSPSVITSHVVGRANASSDTYAFGIRQFNSGGDIDLNFGKIAVTENVRVTAIIDPTITFMVDNVGTTNAGTVRCGTALGNGAINTTASSVAFGPLSLSAFNQLAQRFSCDTNAVNGYVVQVFENRTMTMIGSATTIPDTTCPSNSCTVDTAAVWNSASNSGFGYSLEVGTTGVTLGVGSTTQFKPFGVGYSNARSIMSRASVPSAGGDWAYICYRIAASNNQAAGTYENSISFIATATF